jgi:hypothetical protein
MRKSKLCWVGRARQAPARMTDDAERQFIAHQARPLAHPSTPPQLLAPCSSSALPLPPPGARPPPPSPAAPSPPPLCAVRDPQERDHGDPLTLAQATRSPMPPTRRRPATPPTPRASSRASRSSTVRAPFFCGRAMTSRHPPHGRDQLLMLCSDQVHGGPHPRGC